MDEIHFFCVICGESLCAKAKSAGGFCDCPRCERVVPIPGYPSDPGRLVNSAPAYSPRILAIEIKFLCDHCGSRLRVDARCQGRMRACAVCREETKVPEWSGGQPSMPLDELFTFQTASLARLSAEEREFLSTPYADSEAPLTANHS
jgi:hypothetical protein